MRRVIPLALLLVACTQPDVTPTTGVPSDTSTSGVTTSTTSSSSSTSTLPTTTTTTLATTTTTVATTTTTTVATTTTTTRPPTTTTTQASGFSLAYQEVASMSFPIHMVARPGSSNAYVATKGGRIYLLTGGSISPNPVLNISGRVAGGSEQGLLAMALHPSNNSRIFLHYSATNGDTVIAEYAFSSPTSIDPNSERIIFRHDQPAGNHNGGSIFFGPGGLLYAALGDGGGGNDQYNNGQNPDTLLGGIITLSVDGDPNPTLYNMGLRNPWRTFLDGSTLYVADVGQNRYEEINVVSIQAGRNFGWPIMEGNSCHQPSSGCNTSGLVRPVVVVSHGDQGTCSLTGGVVYRGSQLPEINGHYFYSDWCGGYLRSFRWTGSVTSATNWTSQVGRPGNVTSFGLDGAGEMYVLTNTALYKVVRG